MKRRGERIVVASSLVAACCLALAVTISAAPFEPHWTYWAKVTIVVTGLSLAVAYLIRVCVTGERNTGDVESACIRCGYSLTGNVSGVCPECGTPVGGTG
jgi:hypothetical protein